MKKILTLMILMSLFFLSGCARSGLMELTYTAQSGYGLKQQPVYLLVHDERPDSGLVGPAAREEGLLEELSGGRFDMVTLLPTGTTITRTNIDAMTAVAEAVSHRLELMGVRTTAQSAAGQLNLLVKINQMNIDLEGSELVARVTLAIEAYRDRNNVVGRQNSAESRRLRLVGGSGGAKVLSDALTSALNLLDFQILNER